MEPIGEEIAHCLTRRARGDVGMLGSLELRLSVLFIHPDVRTTQIPMVVAETATCAQGAPTVAESEASLGTVSHWAFIDSVARRFLVAPVSTPPLFIQNPLKFRTR